MSNHTWILDAGHGGVDAAGNYTTDKKLWKRCDYPDGFTILEGIINRQITKKVYTLLEGKGINFALVYHDVEDWSLTKRVNLANKLQEKYGNCIYLAIHSNAGGGKGFEIFTSIGQTKSDKVADIFCSIYKKSFPDYPFRAETTDGDLDKEAKFTVLTNTVMPAVLVENLFFDERKQAEFLASESGQDKIAECIVAAIEEVEKTKPV